MRKFLRKFLLVVVSGKEAGGTGRARTAHCARPLDDS